MKTVLLTIFIIFVGPLAKANPIPPERLESYKQAAVTAISDAGISCRFGYPIDYIIIIPNSQSGELSSSGAQPLLIFSYVLVDKRKIDTVITSSADFKKVIDVTFRDYAWGPINVGTLQDPRIIEGYQKPVILRCTTNLTGTRSKARL